MAVKITCFTGTVAPTMLPSHHAALEEFNAWRNQNHQVRLIGVETVQRIPLEARLMQQYIEPSFEMFRVWYEE